MTFCMTAVTDTFTCVSLFKVRRTNFSGSHWQMEKQGHLTGNSCHSHLLPQEAFKALLYSAESVNYDVNCAFFSWSTKFYNYRESLFWGHFWGANTSFPSQLSERYGTTGTIVCFVRMWMLPALNPRRKAVGNCNCSTTCKENCTIHDRQKSNYQNEYHVHFAFYTLVKWSVLNPLRFEGYWEDIESKVRSLYLYTLKSRKFCSTNDFSINPERFFCQFVVCPSFTIPLGMIHISSLIPGLKNLSLHFKR